MPQVNLNNVNYYMYIRDSLCLWAVYSLQAEPISMGKTRECYCSNLKDLSHFYLILVAGSNNSDAKRVSCLVFIHQSFALEPESYRK